MTTTHSINPLQGSFFEISILKKDNIDSVKIITMIAETISFTDGLI